MTEEDMEADCGNRETLRSVKKISPTNTSNSRYLEAVTKKTPKVVLKKLKLSEIKRYRIEMGQNESCLVARTEGMEIKMKNLNLKGKDNSQKASEREIVVETPKPVCHRSLGKESDDHEEMKESPDLSEERSLKKKHKKGRYKETEDMVKMLDSAIEKRSKKKAVEEELKQPNNSSGRRKSSKCSKQEQKSYSSTEIAVLKEPVSAEQTEIQTRDKIKKQPGSSHTSHSPSEKLKHGKHKEYKSSHSHKDKEKMMEITENVYSDIRNEKKSETKLKDTEKLVSRNVFVNDDKTGIEDTKKAEDVDTVLTTSTKYSECLSGSKKRKAEEEQKSVKEGKEKKQRTKDRLGTQKEKR